MVQSLHVCCWYPTIFLGEKARLKFCRLDCSIPHVCWLLLVESSVFFGIKNHGVKYPKGKIQQKGVLNGKNEISDYMIIYKMLGFPWFYMFSLGKSPASLSFLSLGNPPRSWRNAWTKSKRASIRMRSWLDRTSNTKRKGCGDILTEGIGHVYPICSMVLVYSPT